MTEEVWAWVVAAYSAPGVSEQCLNLQDEHDQNVPLLLWAAWAATHSFVSEEVASQAAGMARAWSEAAIIPLRSVRRRLKQSVSEGDTSTRLALREQVKAVELQAEKVLLAQLAGLNAGNRQVPHDLVPAMMREALLTVASAWSVDFPAEKLARLTQALSEGLVLRYNS